MEKYLHANHPDARSNWMARGLIFDYPDGILFANEAISGSMLEDA